MRKIIKWVIPLVNLIYLYVYTGILVKKSKRVLLVPEFGKYGGTRTYFFSLLEFLKEQNYDVTVELSEEQQDDEVLKQLSTYGFKYINQEYDFGRIAFNEKLFSKFNINPLKRTIHATIHYLRVMKKNEVCAIITSIGSPDKYLFFFLLPGSLLYIIHTVVDQEIEKIRRLWVRKLSLKKQIITVSEYARNKIIENWHLLHKERYVYKIYNHYQKKKNAYKIGGAKKNNDLIILTIGSVEWYKNPSFWVQIAREVIKTTSEVKFYWIGSGSEIEEWRELTRDEDRIVFWGADPDVEKWYNKADVYFQPSKKESFGIAVVGAMAHALPCIVSDQEGLPEVIDNNKTGYLITIDDRKDSLVKFFRLLNNKDLRLELGKRSSSKYREKFSKEVWENSMKKFFTEWS
ncbi:glycosyltransferase family 4 protein [Phaeodactylibacter luteus]|uniref:Glycosyltransferase family 4 protein n=1 Tax=Phaeodactylibacter luteus TaxID=1564516 RepID=A0A5C6RPC6_9BACT|nr:glycosyltransferase family 4 protein [Phaeodactylibacter luteus]TXB63795.1 glycosyltransferase family 4 protein [Phaeodactylibacter luteus]